MYRSKIMSSKEPTYECENDYGCSCTEGIEEDDFEIEPEWEWNEVEEYWECISCGDIQ
jgi:hypothetical protein